MTDFAILREWVQFGVRWLHVSTALAWIGSSFYFIALDLGPRRTENLPALASGEEWQVHGGGSCHINKYLVAPPTLPEHLIWFKWESYATWLSGFAMLAVLYYAGANLFLIDRNVLDVPAWVLILISLASLSIGWLVYDFLCKSPIGKHTTGLMLVLFGVLVVMAWGYAHLFTGRAALLHLGAFTATVMSANVFFIIIPNQKIVVADLKAGRTPAAYLGEQAKQRSLHNNYLTLPVIFLMLSNHYPLAFATAHNWIIAALVFLMGVLIRHYFNSRHARKGNPHWTWAPTALIFIAIMWLSSNPRLPGAEAEASSASEQAFVNDPHFAAVRDIVLGRCSMCHTAEPDFMGVTAPPKDVILDSDAAIAARARQIAIQAGLSSTMAPGNVSHMEPKERQLIVAWYRESPAASGRMM